MSNVLSNWPLLVQALGEFGIDGHATEIAAAATTQAETGLFWPIEEYGDEQYFINEFGVDQWVYHGRGDIQLSWRSGYQDAGDALGVNLVGNPALALDPTIAARVLAWYFKVKGIVPRANAGDWYGVRFAVNGGWNGLTPFLNAVEALSSIPDGPPVHAVTRVAVPGALKQKPDHGPDVAIGPDGKPIYQLPVGTVVTFTMDPRLKRIVTPHWACIKVANSPAWGWYLRASLITTFQAATASEPTPADAPASAE